MQRKKTEPSAAEPTSNNAAAVTPIPKPASITVTLTVAMLAFARLVIRKHGSSDQNANLFYGGREASKARNTRQRQRY